MVKIRAALLSLLVILLSNTAMAAITLYPHGFEECLNVPQFPGCNFVKEGIGPVGVHDSGTAFTALPSPAIPINLTEPGGAYMNGSIDLTAGLDIDYQVSGVNSPLYDSWATWTDILFTVDAVETFGLMDGNLSLVSSDSNPVFGRIDFQVIDETNNVVLYRSLQEGQGAVLDLDASGGGNLTDVITGSPYGQFYPGNLYRITLEMYSDFISTGAPAPATASMDGYTATLVPEPSMASGFLAGTLLLAGLARRRLSI